MMTLVWFILANLPLDKFSIIYRFIIIIYIFNYLYCISLPVIISEDTDYYSFWRMIIYIISIWFITSVCTFNVRISISYLAIYVEIKLFIYDWKKNLMLPMKNLYQDIESTNLKYLFYKRCVCMTIIKFLSGKQIRTIFELLQTAQILNQEVNLMLNPLRIFYMYKAIFSYDFIYFILSHKICS